MRYRVAAVIPAYNAERYLSVAIESVLGQTVGPPECVVVDDGSTDGTALVARSFGRAVRYLAKERGGVSSARNLGARATDADLIAFLDADDVWAPVKLERQLELYESASPIAVVCGLRYVDEGGSPLSASSLPALGENALMQLLRFDHGPLGFGSTGLVARATLHAVRGFDTDLSTSADWELMVRLGLRGRIAAVEEPLVDYRQHPGSMSRSVDLMSRDMTVALDKVYRTWPGGTRPARLRRESYGRFYRVVAASYWRAGEHRKAARFGVKLLAYPAQLAALVGQAIRGWRR